MDPNQGEEFERSPFCNAARAAVKVNLGSKSSKYLPAAPLPRKPVHYHCVVNHHFNGFIKQLLHSH